MSNICNDVVILNFLVIFKNVINLVKIIVPVILVIFVILDIIKSVSSSDVDNKKLFKSVSKRLIAAVIIFLVPTILNTVLNLVPNNNNMYYLDCYQNATKDRLEEIAVGNADESISVFETAIKVCEDEPTKKACNAAYSLYEPARQDVKSIPNKETKEKYEKELANLKIRLDNQEKEIKQNGQT